jgi:ubiquinone/menaquinone biosynthesis C-methylase UbiE
MHRYYDDRWREDDIDELAALMRPHFADPPEPRRGRLLDLGGGAGGLAIRLADSLDVDVLIVDPTPELISRVPDHGSVKTELGSAEAIPRPDAYFDAVVISDALHHFRDPTLAVRELTRVVRPGGGVTVLEFDVRGWRRLLAYAERLVGEPAHFFTPTTLTALMCDHGVSGSTRSRGWSYTFHGEVAPTAECPGGRDPSDGGSPAPPG